jgi:hypothetical protein
MKRYVHIIHLVNGKTISWKNDRERLDITLGGGYACLVLKSEITETHIPMTSVLHIISSEVSQE